MKYERFKNGFAIALFMPRAEPQQREPLILRTPLYHGGDRIDTLVFDGHPFGRNFDSPYEAMKGRIPFYTLEKRYPEIDALDSSCVNRLEAELLAYAVRAENSLCPRNGDQVLGSALVDMDQIVRIAHMVSLYADASEVRGQYREFLGWMMANRDGMLAIAAGSVKNYKWAEKLFEDSIAYLGGRTIRGSPLFEAYHEHVLGESGSEERVGMKGDYDPNTLKAAFEHGLREMNGDAAKDPIHKDVVPRLDPMPNSLAFELGKAIEGQDFEYAALLKQDKDHLIHRFHSSDSTPFIKWVGEHLALNVMGYETGCKLSKFDLESIAPKGSFGVSLSISDYPASLPTIHTDRGCHSRVLGLVHSMPFVLRFNRFAVYVFINGMYDGNHLLQG